MKKTIKLVKQVAPKLISVVLMVVLFAGLTGCGAPATETHGPKSGEEISTDSIVVQVNQNDNDNDDDVIVAGTVDTSSDFTFEVDGAFVGIDEYSDEPVVILVGEFTNNSKETISYGWALDAVAFQSGHELKTSYLRGASVYTYEDIEPGVTTPVFIGWKILNVMDSIEITVIDSRHYAKEELFKKTYTIDELIKNTLEYLDEYSGIVDSNQGIKT